jgi:hypothetical protein
MMLETIAFIGLMLFTWVSIQLSPKYPKKNVWTFISVLCVIVFGLWVIVGIFKSTGCNESNAIAYNSRVGYICEIDRGE